MAIGDSTRVNTNIAALNSLNALNSINRNLEISQLKLATGLRINEVADDPAGFTISRRLDARSRGLSVALDNVGTVKNVLSIAEGGLLNIQKILIVMKEKVLQARYPIHWASMSVQLLRRSLNSCRLRFRISLMKLNSMAIHLSTGLMSVSLFKPVKVVIIRFHSALQIVQTRRLLK